jgi:hypothetical protein
VGELWVIFDEGEQYTPSCPGAVPSSQFLRIWDTSTEVKSDFMAARSSNGGLRGCIGLGDAGIGGESAVLKRLHFPSKSLQPSKGGIGFL